MSATVVTVDKLSKIYPVYAKPVDIALELFTGRSRHRDFVALKDVSFTLGEGDILGIVGANGAGKSTLLKILAGTLAKSAGEIDVVGRISAILELGTGFHPEYTGRENIYMGGMCLGMTRQEIEKEIESIIDFSGIRPHIDQPFKTYSSGMQARLTFSLVVGIDPDILIIDEALAVGDAIFVNKCIGKIRELCVHATTIFVSHNLEMVRRFCNKAMWLDGGHVVALGDVDSTTKAYERYIYEQSERYLKSNTTESFGASTARELIELSKQGQGVVDLQANPEFFKFGSKEIVISGFKAVDKDGRETRQFTSGGYMELRVYYEGFWDSQWQLHAGCQIFTDKGTLVFTPSTDSDKTVFGSPLKGKGVFRFILEPLLLGSGEYLLGPNITLVKGDQVRWVDWHDRLYRVRVSSSKYKYAYIIEHPVVIKCEADEKSVCR